MKEGLPMLERSWWGTWLRSHAEGDLAFCLETERTTLTAAVDPRGCGRVLGQFLWSLLGALLAGLMPGSRADARQPDRPRVPGHGRVALVRPPRLRVS